MSTLALPLLRRLLLVARCAPTAAAVQWAAVRVGPIRRRPDVDADADAAEDVCWSDAAAAAPALVAAAVAVLYFRGALGHSLRARRLDVSSQWRFGWGWLQAKLFLAVPTAWHVSSTWHVTGALTFAQARNSRPTPMMQAGAHKTRL